MEIANHIYTVFWMFIAVSAIVGVETQLRNIGLALYRIAENMKNKP